MANTSVCAAENAGSIPATPPESIMFVNYLFHKTKYYLAFIALFAYFNSAKVCAPSKSVILKNRTTKKSVIRENQINETAQVEPCFKGVKPGKLTKKERAFILSIKDGAPLEDKLKFYRLVYKAYLTLTKNAVLSAGLATQFVLESGYGATVTGRFNYGGIKEFDAGKPRTLCRTTEMNCAAHEIRAYKARKHYYGRAYAYGATVHYVSDYFKDFNSLRAYLRYKTALIKTGASYKKNGCASAKTISEYCDCLDKAGYATDPNYGTKIKAVVEFWNEFIKR